MKLDPSSELYRMRHSAAHVMAAAVCRIFPMAKIAADAPVDRIARGGRKAHRLDVCQEIETAAHPPNSVTR